MDPSFQLWVKNKEGYFDALENQYSLHVYTQPLIAQSASLQKGKTPPNKCPVAH